LVENNIGNGLETLKPIRKTNHLISMNQQNIHAHS